MVLPNTMRTCTPLFTLGLMLAATPALAQDGAAPGETPNKGKTAPSASAAAIENHRATLLDFTNRIADLERRILRAEKRADVLKSSALTGNVAQTRAVILHLNRLGGGFTMDRATYVLDGKVIYDGENKDGRLDSEEALQLFAGPIRAGDHNLEVMLKVRGRAYGPFTYLEGYKFNIQSKYVFQVIEGRHNRLEIIATQKDDITLEPQDRLTVAYEAGAQDVSAKTDKKPQ